MEQPERHRVPHGTFESLEPRAGKLARAVRKGRGQRQRCSPYPTVGKGAHTCHLASQLLYGHVRFGGGADGKGSQDTSPAAYSTLRGGGDGNATSLPDHVRKYDGKLLITPSKKSVKALLDKVRALMKANKQAKTGNLILQLNSLLRGWAQYHRHVVSKETFAAVDAAVFKLVWRWAKRRHPHKGARWVRKTYFRTQGYRQWVFSGEIVGKGGRAHPVHLFSTLRVPIKRHTKVRQGANPYDPAWEEYFEARLSATMKTTYAGGQRQRYLWEEQQGLCPICDQTITTQTGWEAHHIVWRSKGGSASTENQVLLHPNCHKLVHSQGVTVVKPRPARGDREARAG